jgi:hypothetical protein
MMHRTSDPAPRPAVSCTDDLARLRRGASLAPFSWRDGHGDRSARCASASSLLALVVVLDHLADMRFALRLVGRGLDVLEGVGRLYKDRVVDDNLRVCPARWQAGVRVSPFMFQSLVKEMYSRSRNCVEQLLRFLGDALALLRVLLLHLADGLLLPRL